MPLVPLEIPPGVYKNGTDLYAKDRWADANLVRWVEGIMRPIGGWRSFTESGIANIVRGMVAWRDNSDNRFIALGTNEKLYALEASGTVSDITPTGLTIGFETAQINTGYSGGTYGTGTYGTARTNATQFSEASVWQLDTWGEYLVACSSADGKIYEWQLNPAAAAAQVSNSPTGCSGVFVTEERFLFALGADGNPRKIAWCDREDNTQWTALATNQAGDIELQSAGAITQAVRTRGQTLIVTDVDAHTATFVGGQVVYSFDRVGDSCGAISRQCVVSAAGTAFWMGRRGFYVYAGGAAEPLPSEVSDYVYSDINRDKFSHIWGVANQQYNEVWWFYVSGGSNEIDSYVSYNYLDRTWSIGKLERTSGVDAGTWRYPMWIDASKEIFEHEFAFYHQGLTAYAETGPIMIGAGDNVSVVTQLYPDEDTKGEVTATFKTRFYPNGVEREYGPYTMGNPTDVRFTGRQVRMRVTSNTADDWRVGIMRLDTKEGGRR